MDQAPSSSVGGRVNTFQAPVVPGASTVEIGSICFQIFQKVRSFFLEAPGTPNTFPRSSRYVHSKPYLRTGSENPSDCTKEGPVNANWGFRYSKLSAVLGIPVQVPLRRRRITCCPVFRVGHHTKAASVSRLLPLTKEDYEKSQACEAAVTMQLFGMCNCGLQPVLAASAS